MQVWSLGLEDPLEKEMATHSSILAWEIPWTEEPGGLQSMGSQRVRHDWATKQQQQPKANIDWVLLGVRHCAAYFGSHIPWNLLSNTEPTGRLGPAYFCSVQKSSKDNLGVRAPFQPDQDLLRACVPSTDPGFLPPLLSQMSELHRSLQPSMMTPALFPCIFQRCPSTISLLYLY